MVFETGIKRIKIKCKSTEREKKILTAMHHATKKGKGSECKITQLTRKERNPQEQKKRQRNKKGEKG